MKAGEDVIVLAGTHGDKYGFIAGPGGLPQGRRASCTMPDSLTTDRAWGSIGNIRSLPGKLVILDVKRLTNRGLAALVNTKANVVAAWCKSERSIIVNDALPVFNLGK